MDDSWGSWSSPCILMHTCSCANTLTMFATVSERVESILLPSRTLVHMPFRIFISIRAHKFQLTLSICTHLTHFWTYTKLERNNIIYRLRIWTYTWASTKTKFPSLRLFSLLYPHTEKNEIDVSLKCGIAVPFLIVLWVVVMLFSRVVTRLPTFANVTTCTWQIFHTSFGNITNYLSAYF